VPEYLEGIYKKHKDLFATDLDAALNNFGQFVKVLLDKCMAMLVVDVHAASVASNSFTMPCPEVVDGLGGEKEKQHAKETIYVVMEDIDKVENVVKSSHAEPPRASPSPAQDRVDSDVPSRPSSPQSDHLQTTMPSRPSTQQPDHLESSMPSHLSSP
jgi:hypothetical protein